MDRRARGAPGPQMIRMAPGSCLAFQRLSRDTPNCILSVLASGWRPIGTSSGSDMVPWWHPQEVGFPGFWRGLSPAGLLGGFAGGKWFRGGGRKPSPRTITPRPQAPRRPRRLRRGRRHRRRRRRGAAGAAGACAHARQKHRS
eukprot:gene24894-biopygen11950